MPKNIVLLLDGTSNEIKQNRSNILRLYGTLKKDETQLVYYDPGVGTFGADSAWSRTWRKVVEVWGMATGWGLDQNVLEAYRFLVEHYDNGKRVDAPDEGHDHIYIFGFSRGAYTARVLAGFIHAFGLVQPRNLNLIDYAYAAYKQIDDDKPDSFAEIELHKRIVQPDHVPIDCLGLFDTVSTVIESGRVLPRLKKHAFTRQNPSIRCIRHAVAIDERRTMFRPQLWSEKVRFAADKDAKDEMPSQDVREVWFAGVHGDVGGGYPEAKSGLAKIPLHWMVEQTEAEGLYYRSETVNHLVLGQHVSGKYAVPDPQAKKNESMRGPWPILEYLPRLKPEDSKRRDIFGWTLPLFELRYIPDGARVHKSVQERMEATKYNPKNLPAQFTLED